MARRYFLVKSEPDAYSLDDLERDGKTPWDGVRNYQARNVMRDEMQVGDRVLYYHSNAKPPAVVGIAEVASAPYSDPTQFDPKSRYHDEKATPDEPRWFVVDLAFLERLPRAVGLPELKDEAALADMVLLNRSRLSVQPVEKRAFDHIVKLARRAP